MSNSALAGLRDASWFNSIGRGGKYHIATDADTAACNPDALPLYERTFKRADEVPGFQRCMRSGCRQRWPEVAALTQAMETE